MSKTPIIRSSVKTPFSSKIQGEMESVLVLSLRRGHHLKKNPAVRYMALSRKQRMIIKICSIGCRHREVFSVSKTRKQSAKRKQKLVRRLVGNERRNRKARTRGGRQVIKG